MIMPNGESMRVPLDPSRYDLANDTQANDFLKALLDDTVLQRLANDRAIALCIALAVVITVAGLARGVKWVIRDRRKRTAARLQSQSPSRRPEKDAIGGSNLIISSARTLRMISYMPLSPPPGLHLIALPSLGTTGLILAQLTLALGLEFGGDTATGPQHWQDLSVRAAWLAISQMPLIVLLSTKKNWITLVTGVSYERLNVLHRWSSRVMLLLAIFHVGFQIHGWSRFRNILNLEWTTDKCIPTGLAAFVLLVWINVSTIIPIRRLSYELFIAQHILTFFGFIIAIMMHLPTTALPSRVWIYVAIGFYVLDRLLRTASFAFINRTSHTTTLSCLPGNVTKIQVRGASVKSWTAGSHMLLTFPTLGFGQSHPATIASTPDSHQGDLVFILKSRQGLTSKLHTTAKVHKDDAAGGERPHLYRILLDGPYGGHQADFATFDSVCLIAGSTGMTFVMSILLNVAQTVTMREGRVPLRRVQVVWAVKEVEQLSWARADLAQSLEALYRFGVQPCCRMYVTGEQTSATLGPIFEEGVKCSPLTTDSGDSGSQIGGSSFETIRARPDLRGIVEQSVAEARRECGIAVCGPNSMSDNVRAAVARLGACSLWPGSSRAAGAYLHVEGFASS